VRDLTGYRPARYAAALSRGVQHSLIVLGTFERC
jgi:hypothetical protein